MRSRFLRIAGVSACFLALSLTLGAHWSVLQSIAWARMLADFSRSGSWNEAIVKTFDGKHPCAMCLQIRDGRQQQEREQEKLPWSKTSRAPDLFVEIRSAFAPLAPTAAADAVPFVRRWSSDYISPPLRRPPRLNTPA